MHNTKMRTIFCFAVLALVLLFAVPALGAEPDITITVGTSSVTSGTVYEAGGEVTIPLWVRANGADQTIVQIIPKGQASPVLENAVFVPETATGTTVNTTGTMIFIDSDVSSTLSGGTSYPVTLLVYGATYTDPKEITFNVYKNSPSSVTTPPPSTTNKPEDEEIKALTLDAIGADGQVVAAPAGDAGDRVTLRLPIKCRQGVVSGAEITPVLSSDLNEFPFVIEAVDYTRRLPNLGIGNVTELQYEMTISKEATSGVKGITFNAVYYKNGVLETNSFKVYVNVLKGKAEEVKDKDGNLITSMPKLIVESYSVKPKEPQEGDPEGRLFAGEPFVLEFTVRNTSDRESVQNIQMTLSNANNAVLPANGSSNAMYIKSIGKGESEKCSIELQSVPDADSKPQNLTIEFDYEGAALQKQYNTKQDLTLAVAQRMRVKIDEPTVYAEGLMPGGTAGVSFGVYNQGKGTIYNCMIEVEGQGLKLEESVSGGNITAGNSMRADFSVVASEPGDIEGKIIVTYEDVYQEQTRVELPISLYVMDDSAMMEFGEDPMMGEEVMGEGQPTGGFPWLWVGIGAAVLAALIVLLVLRKKKRRRRELEDA